MIERKMLRGHLQNLIERVDAQIQEARIGLDETNHVPTLGNLFMMVASACRVMGWHPGTLDEIDIDFYVSEKFWKNRYTVILGDPPECGVLFNHRYEYTYILYYNNHKENQ